MQDVTGWVGGIATPGARRDGISDPPGLSGSSGIDDPRPSSGRQPWLVITALTLLATACALLASALDTSDRPTTAVVWGGFALAALIFGLLCLVGGALFRDLGLGRWKVGSLMLAWYALAYGVASVSWSQPQVGTATQITVPSVLRALWLVAVGIIAWSAGYLLGPGRPAQLFAARAARALGRRFGDQVRGPAAPWILYAIGMAARFGDIASTGVFGYVGNVSGQFTTASSFGGVLGTVAQCAPLAVAVAAIRVFVERRRYAWITLVILFSAEVTYGALSGFKGTFITAVIAVAIPFSVSRRRLPKVPLILGALVFLLIVIPFNGTYRSIVRNGSVTLSPAQAVSVAPEILRQTLSGNGGISVLSSSVSYLMQRIREIDSVAIIVQRTPQQIGFRSPVQLIEEPAAGVIPRALWPGKPLNLTGYEFNQEYFGAPSTVYTSTAETLVGGLYIYGGWLPVLAGMFVIGCAIRLLDDQFDVRTNPHGVLLVLLVFPLLVIDENDWGTVLSSIPATAFVWLLAIAVAFGRPKREPPLVLCTARGTFRPLGPGLPG